MTRQMRQLRCCNHRQQEQLGVISQNRNFIKLQRIWSFKSFAPVICLPSQRSHNMPFIGLDDVFSASAIRCDASVELSLLVRHWIDGGISPK